MTAVNSDQHLRKKCKQNMFFYRFELLSFNMLFRQVNPFSYCFVVLSSQYLEKSILKRSQFSFN